MGFKGDLEALILAVIGDHALHGYEISKRIRTQSQDVLKYGEGQLYPALHKLEESGFVAAEWIEQDGKPNRKVYSLTPAGKVELEKRKSAWTKFVAGVGGVFSAQTMEEGK
ncbi:MAG: helix-turn-helix transcriptional regulator [Armatimonadetes bacterium]|nr:PadR family transcriptional regulator [Armatimonadota bacterium]MBS1700423.1 helix-turn-helix transcriptional regulator [Armatimonadota bacterium]